MGTSYFLNDDELEIFFDIMNFFKLRDDTMRDISTSLVAMNAAAPDGAPPRRINK
jgi:hypothetical protein